MKIRTKLFVTQACALALSANSLTALAQNSPQNPATEKKVERRVWVNAEGDTFNVRVPEPGHRVATINGISTGNGPQVMAFNGTGGQDGFSYSFVASEVGAAEKLVKGAPYSAETANEFVQMLANGNRIVRSNKSNTYRDGQGRTRREQSLMPLGFGGALPDFAPGKTTIITDPVAGFIYILNEKTKTAQRLKIGGANGIGGGGGNVSFTSTSGNVAVINTNITTVTQTEELRKISVSGSVLQGSALSRVQPVYPAEAKAAHVAGPVIVAVTIGETGEVLNAEATSGPALLRDAAVNAARQWKFKPTELQGKAVKVQGNLTFNFTLTDDQNAAPAMPSVATMVEGLPLNRMIRLRAEGKATPLGKQMIEGVECEGTRIVETIPAGQIGNEQAIEIVIERWVSAQLGLTLLSKHSNPLTGETTVKMTNLLRAEPDEYLFKVPSDYTIKDGPQTFVRTTKPE